MYYRKPTARSDLLQARVAVPVNMKEAILAEEGWRRLRNCSASRKLQKKEEKKKRGQS